MNDDALAYSSHCEMQKADADHFLKKYSNLIKWTDNSKILDIGSAEGTISLEVLLREIPSNFQKLVLSDISSRLLNVAREKIGDPRVDCLELDIAGVVPNNLKNNFDHVFSFYCLNFIPEKRTPQAMKNIFNLLKPGGGALMSAIGTLPFYDMLKGIIAEKWPSCMPSFQKIISLYHCCESPDAKFRRFLEEAGFEVALCKHEKRTYTYGSWEKFMGFAFSILPFSKILSESERSQFVEDFVREARQFHLVQVEEDDDGTEKIHMSYYVLVAFVSKPSM